MTGEFDAPEVQIAEAPATPPEPASAPPPAVTNEYDTLLAQGPAAAAPARVGNEYDGLVVDLGRERSQRLRATVLGAQKSTPDAAAKSLVLSRKTGLPTDLVERNLPKVEGEQKLNEYDSLLSKSPKLADWLTADPVNAKVAGSEGDFSKLSLIEEGVNELNRGLLGQQANAGFAGWKVASKKLAELEGALGRQSRGEYLTPFDKAMIAQEPAIRETMKDAIIEYGGQFYARQGEAAELPLRPVVKEMQEAGKSGDWGGVWEALKKDPLGAIYSISLQSAAMLPWQIGGYMAAGPVGAFAVSFLMEYMGGVTDAMEQAGVNMQDPTQVTKAFANPELMAKVEQQAAIKAGTIAAFDTASLKLASVPMGFGKSAVVKGGTNIVAQVGVQGAAGAAGEAAGSALAGMKVDPFAVVAEALGEMGSAPVEVATTRWTEIVRRDATREEFEKFKALPPLEQLALGNAIMVDRLIEQATNTKIAALSPEKLQEFIGSISAAAQTIFVPAEIVATFMQDMTSVQAEAFATRLGISEQLTRIARTGEDVAIPLAMYVTGAGEAHAAWRQDIRTEVDGFSVRQAQEWEKNRAAETKAAIDRFEEQIAAGIGEIDAKTRVYQHMLEQLKISGNYTNEVAAQHAALYAARYEARAARNPERYADAWEAFQQAGTGKGVQVRSELPESIRVLGPDRLDVMLNSIRSGKEPPKAKLAATAPKTPDLVDRMEPPLGFLEGALPNSAKVPASFKPDAKLLDIARRLARGWGPEKNVEKPQRLVDFVKKNGGLNLASSEAGDVRASDLGRIPGLLQRKGKRGGKPTGRSIDHAAQAAADAGFRFGQDTEYGSGVDVDAFLQALIEDASGSRHHYPDDAQTDAWWAQQEYFDQFAEWIKEGVEWNPKSRDAREIAWFLSQDAGTQRLMALAERVDNLGPDSSLEAVYLIDAELAKIERDTIERLEAKAETLYTGQPPTDGLSAEEWEKLHGELDRTLGDEESIRRGAEAAGRDEAGTGDPASGDRVADGASQEAAGDRPSAVDPLEAFRASQRQLQDYLDGLGLDPKALSNAQIRAALEAAAKPGGQTFDQGGRSLEAVREKWAAAGLTGDISENRGIITLSRIVVPEADRERGAGTAAMQALIDYADATGQRIALTPSADFGGNKRRLVAFYKGLGFKENKGRTIDHSISETMIREPASTYNQAVYHGSPHVFDKFTLDHIGTGEGVQAFGWGLYFAGSKAVAKYYREKLSASGVGAVEYGGKTVHTADGKPLRARPEWLADWGNDLQALIEIAVDNDMDLPAAIAKVREETKKAGFIRRFMGYGFNDRFLQAILDKDYRLGDVEKGRLYHVEIPDDGAYVAWDKTLGEQPENVRKALAGKVGDAQTVGSTLYRAYHNELFAGDITGKDRASPRELSEWLLAQGVPGIKYLDGSSRGKGEGNHNYVLFDDSLINIQSYEQEARGSISFGDNRAIIRLFEGRDLSTLAHESGHLWLAELEFDVKHVGAGEQAKADWQTVLDFVGSTDGYITREQHELFARAFETYLMEGKAPSEGLRGVFRSFKNWLISIYRNLAALQAPISPEMRQVFDRLLATDDEIEAAKNAQGFNPLFKDAKSAEMTEAEFKAYTKNVSRVVDEAEQRVLEKVMASIRRERTKEVAAEKAKIRGEVKAELMADPGQAALHFLRNGTMFAGETPEVLKGKKLSRPGLIALLGQDGLNRLPVRVYAEEGIDPTDAAQLFGLGNGTELVERLMQIQAEQLAMRAKGDNRSLINVRIAEETQRRLTESMGDPLNDGSIEAEAMAAVHSDKQGALMASELKVLARKAGHSGAVSLDDIKAWAANAIGEMSSYQATQFAKYQRAERLAGQKVQRALVKGDFMAAFRAKQDQLVNFALYQEAKKAADDADSIRKRMDRYASAAQIKSMDQEALNAIHEILEEYDFKKRSGALLAERTLFNAFAEQQRELGIEVLEPPRLKGAQSKHFSQMTMDELRGLSDTVEQMAKLGRLKKELLDGQKKRDFEAVVAEGMTTAAGRPQRGVSRDDTGLTPFQERMGRLVSGIKSGDSSLIKLETLFEWLDGDKTGRGIFTRLGFKPFADAQGRERDRLVDLNDKLKALYALVPAEQRAEWLEVHDIQALPKPGGRAGKFNKTQLIAMALNIGNQSSLEKLTAGMKWDEQAVRVTLDKYLTREEWQFVQNVWDLIDTQWPELKAVHERVTGLAPPKIEAIEVPTPFGPLRGGYYPAVYDPNLSTKAAKIGAKADVAATVGEIFPGGAFRPSTRAGATHARTGFEAPIRLSLDVIVQHLTDVSHDIEFREAILNAHKFFSDDRIKQAIIDAVGPEYEEQIDPWLKNIAHEWVIDRQGLNAVQKFANTLRTNVVIVGLGFRISTMLAQTAGYSNSVQRLGAVRMADGLRAFAKAPIQQFEFVHAKSAEMRHRANDLERDLRAAQLKMQGKTGFLNDVRRFAFKGIAWADAAVSIPTWIGAYNQGLADHKMTDEQAVYYADKMVRDTQGSGAAKDMAAIQRGGPLLKLFTMFYSYFNVFYNRQRSLARDVRDPGVSWGSVVAQTFWLLVLPSLLSPLLTGQGPGDDEEWAEWAARNVFFGLFTGVPYGRDIANTASNKMAGKPFGDPKLSPVEGFGANLVRMGRDAANLVSGEETSKSAIKNLFNVAGVVTALPLGQPGSTAQYVWDVLIEGSENPENLLEWLRGLTIGPEHKR